MSDTFYEPSWKKHFPDQLIIAESTRLGGVSPAPFYSLNLGMYTTDKPENIAQNRQIFCNDLGFLAENMAGAHQVHGDRILRVHRAGQWEGYDAFVTNKKEVVLSVTIADCTPVLLYDPVQKAVGAAHAGWKGTVAEIAAKTLLYMRDAFGTQPKDCWAFIGSCIGKQDFEVDADVSDHFDEAFKSWVPSRGKFLVDLKAANASQLERLGVPTRQIERSPFSTADRNDVYFSHRAEKGQTGRMLAVIGLL